MAQVVVRRLEEGVKQALKARAARHGCSMEEEVRRILRRAVQEEPAAAAPGLGSRIAARFAGLGLDDEWPTWRGHEAQPMEPPR